MKLLDPDVLEDHLHQKDWSREARFNGDPKWRDERNDRILREEWNKGTPTKEIAAILGPDFTKGMIISRAGRIGLGYHPWFRQHHSR